jgi:phage terminase large subunit GpA-like protein
MLVGVDTIKSSIYDKLARGRTIRFSDSLSASYYEELASERKVARYQRGQPVRQFERKPGMAAEALDCAVYATAARAIVVLDVDRRENALRQIIPEATAPTEVRSPWVSAW